VKGRSSDEIQAERLRKAIELTERTQLYLREIQAEIPLQALPMAAKKASFPLQALRYKPRGVSKGLRIADLERGFRVR